MSFRDIVGQARAIRQLQQGIARGAVPSGYLFVGPEGVGKRLTAMALAKALNCEQAQEADSCGTCPTCRKLDHGNYPDLLAVAPEGDGDEISIEAIRQVIHLIGLTPMEARYKVCIVDRAERFNEESANAFLKTLEEPPGATVFILLTRDRERILPTIASRCQELSFQPLPHDFVAQRLQAAVASLAPEVAETLARWAGGGLGKALALAQEELVQEKGTWLNRLTKPDSQFDAIEQLGSGRAKAQRAVELLMTWYRDLLMTQLGAGEAAIHRDLQEPARRASQRWTVEELVGRIEHLERLHRAIDEHANVKLTLAQLTIEVRPSIVEDAR